jgi:hypothetical protein
VEIYTYRTATGSAIENATTRFVITAIGSAIENAAPRFVITATGFVGELKCRIVVTDRHTHRQPKLI